MTYKTFDIEGKEIVQHDLQDKGDWCGKGASFEEVFIGRYPHLGLMINPEKQNNIYAPDLSYIENGTYADLKTQNTPFFLSQSRYEIDPQYAVTFNEKDFLRYRENYPGIDIYFWVDWQAIRFVGAGDISVKPMVGVWRLKYADMIKAVASAPLHRYIQRVGDQKGNAKGSFVLDLNADGFTRIA
ncbi:hypothetical protein [Pedobacter sp. SG908]|uniref:hypothetical protein n=1 Tax=Pedobacter sp. SG908 TaxID=2587135 RepID=UPI0014212318|nr:hypothetical protein [Pedobacter sp. SG908]NII83166.1 hypothetical protein [Pedobacter sp. SG908]